MPVHCDRGELYIVPTDDEPAWKAARRDRRVKVAAWLAIFLLGAIFWTVVFCAVIG